MKNKLYITLIACMAILLFSYSFTFAAENMTAADGIRNVVNGAENAIENAGKGIAGGVRNITSGAENIMENMTTDATNAGNRITRDITTDNGSYNATRTATMTTSNTGDATFLGMNSIAWTWIIMAIVGIAIISLVWMYSKQHINNYNDNNY